MPRRPPPPGALGCRAGVLLALLTACATDRPSGPPDNDEVSAAQTDCGATCVIAEGRLLSAAAEARGDSLTPVPIATVTVRGESGATVRLVAEGDGATRASLAQYGLLWVQVDGGARRALPLKLVLEGATIYRLSEAGNAKIRYELARTLPKGVGSFRLVQLLSSGTVLHRRTPYGPRPSAASSTALSSCSIVASTGTGCGVSYSANPFSDETVIGGTFTSDPGTGATRPIHVIFSPGVQSVTVTIHDPTYAGNRMVATDEGGSLTAGFDFTGQPGENVPDTETLAGTSITALDLIPSTGIEAGDYVAWDVNFSAGSGLTVTCAAVTRGDQITCTASADDPNAQLTVTEWRFESPEIPQPIVEVAGSTTWSGLAAVSGTVKVKGTIDGAQREGVGPLTVTARDWSQDTVAFQLTEVSPSGQPAHPRRVGELGNHQGFAQGYLPPSGFPQIPAGPNKGVFFFTKVPVQALSEIRINRVALRVNSDFYLRQPRNNPPAGRCRRADVMPFLPLAEAHEGLTLAPNSHAGVFRRELNNGVPEATEAVSALNDLSLLQTKVDQAAQPGIQNAATLSLDQVNGGTVPPIPYCTFRYF